MENVCFDPFGYETLFVSGFSIALGLRLRERNETQSKGFADFWGFGEAFLWFTSCEARSFQLKLCVLEWNVNSLGEISAGVQNLLE